MERIICAAVYYDDGVHRVHNPVNVATGLVVCGRRHHEIFPILRMIYADRRYLKTMIQGFVTNTNKFVNREDAALVAICSGQITIDKLKDRHGRLYSEDIY